MSGEGEEAHHLQTVGLARGLRASTNLGPTTTLKDPGPTSRVRKVQVRDACALSSASRLRTTAHPPAASQTLSARPRAALLQSRASGHRGRGRLLPGPDPGII